MKGSRATLPDLARQPSERSSPRIFLSLGSNIEPHINLPRAVRQLAEQVTLRGASRVYASAAVGGPPGSPTFLNAAVEIATRFEPADLKFRILRPLEAELGRTRDGNRNAPRTLDLDLALWGERIIDDPIHSIFLPDPDILRFAHVALPLADLAPGFRHPVTFQTLREISAQLADPQRIRRCRSCRLDPGEG